MKAYKPAGADYLSHYERASRLHRSGTQHPADNDATDRNLWADLLWIGFMADLIKTLIFWLLAA